MATVVDHIKPHRGDKKLFWDRGNWQPLCEHHHNVKTMTEDRYVEYKFRERGQGAFESLEPVGYKTGALSSV